MTRSQAKIGSDPTFELVVVGGGVVGLALAFGMRALGSKLAIVDAGRTPGAPSYGNFGLVWVQGKGAGMASYGSLTQRSAREWPAFASEVAAASGIDVALSQHGGLHPCLSRAELDARERLFAALFAQPSFERYEVEMLEGHELERRLPGVGPGVAGASFCALDGHVNPLRLMEALKAALARAGVVQYERKVAAIEPGAVRFTLITAGGPIEAERIVLAAGLANAKLAPMVGLAAPVHANKGQVIVLERMQPMLPFALETIRQTDEGSVLIGDSQQERSDTSLDPAVLGVIASRAIHVLPALASVRAIRAWAALRVMTPDGFPIYARSGAHPGASVVSCHSGITLAAVHARELAPALVAGDWPEGLENYSPERLADVRASA